MAHAEDIDPIAVVVKADPPIADAQAELGRMKAVEPVDVAGAGSGETMNRSYDAKGNSTVQHCQIRLRLGGKNHSLDHEGS